MEKRPSSAKRNVETPERRKTERMPVEIGELVVLPVQMSVRVLDISLSGVLLQAAHPVERGARGSLRLHLDGMPFTADIEVQRIAPAPDETSTGAYRIGARFVNTSREHQQAIERFIHQ
jgi:c-di-GMP-binding flagellar brake protein YcgR